MTLKDTALDESTASLADLHVYDASDTAHLALLTPVFYWPDKGGMQQTR